MFVETVYVKFRYGIIVVSMLDVSKLNHQNEFFIVCMRSSD